MWHKTPYDDEIEEKETQRMIHSAYERGYKAGLQTQTDGMRDATPSDIGFIHHLTDEAYSELCLLAAKGREALHTLEQIKQIINAPVYIQEDVLRYKMICEVIKE